MIMIFLTVIGAVFLDLLLGDPPNRFHPVALMGKYISTVYRLKPGEGNIRQLLFGLLLVASGFMIFTIPWLLINSMYLPFIWLLNILFLKLVFSIRGLAAAAIEIKISLLEGKIVRARELVGTHLVSRDTSDLDQEYIVSATVESLAENITDSITAPLFFFGFFGMPGAWGYRFCNTCDAMLGYRDREHEFTGKYAALLDTALNWLPARITGCLIVAAALLAGEKAGRAWKTMREQHGRTASPNAGWTMAAMAGALGTRLEKRGSYSLEGGPNAPNCSMIDRALRIISWAAGCAVILCLLIVGLMYACFA